MELLKFCKDLYRMPRSLTGQGVEKTLEYIKQIIPINIKKVKSGTKVFDWVVPPEWNIKDAYIIDLNSGERVVDIKNHNLHIVGYSEPVDFEISYNELIKNLHYIKDQPNAIPYITSYYEKNWGFCMSYNEFKKLDRTSNYRVYIDSEFKETGYLTYGEYLLKGRVKKEILFSSYICHPQMVNNELSGPSVLTGIAKHLSQIDNYYSYRFVLIPETIGSIMYISKNFKILKKNVIGGFNITCVGDERSWGLIPSRYGNNISDQIAENILSTHKPEFTKYSWLERGSDERQYCSPGVDLPIASITRSKYGTYNEYHTSLDNFDLVTENGLKESLDIYLKCVETFEKKIFKKNTDNICNKNNLSKFNMDKKENIEEEIYPKINVFCEPQLGKRGLYSNLSKKDSKKPFKSMMNFISYCDGKNSILDIAELCNISSKECYDYYLKLKEFNLISSFNKTSL